LPLPNTLHPSGIFPTLHGDRKSTGSNFATGNSGFSVSAFEMVPVRKDFSQSFSDGTVTSTFVPQSGTTAGQVGAQPSVHRGKAVNNFLRRAVAGF
jgi:hypothetical protein